jgi:hypothetical protein
MMDEERKQDVPGNPEVMSRQESESYTGITLGEDGKEEKREDPWESSHTHIHIFSWSALPLWKKALYGAIGVVCIGLFLMVAWFFLMGAGVIIGALLVLYLIRKILF